jgi:arylsulfatase A-like enzyme
MRRKRKKRKKVASELAPPTVENKATAEPTTTATEVPETRSKRALWLAIILALVTLVAYLPVFGNEFVNYDDDHYIVNNFNVRYGLSGDGIVYAFTSSHGANWFPLTWLSWMLDYEIYGMEPRGFHMTNLLVHVASVVLLFFVFFRMTRDAGASGFVAAVFALHPTHVELVAWAAERKDALSAFFWRRRPLWLAASLVFSSLLSQSCQSRRERPNVVLITLDTTRVDRMGCYGYQRQTTPVLDGLAAESVVYTRATATSSWTLPAHASLFTGRFTASHGARYDSEGPLRLTDGIDGPENWSDYRARGLSSGETTLAEILKEAGYTTGAIVGGPWMKKVFGLDKGFDHYDDAQIRSVNGRLASEVTSAALQWIEKEADHELFLFLNYFDPHTPYSAPEPFTYQFFPDGEVPSSQELSFEELSNLYDAEILYMDHHIGRLLDGLKRLGLYEHTLFIVTADHGELLGEHGKRGHGTSLFQEEIHIPLFVRYPYGEVPPERRNDPIQLVDILPLVLGPLDLAVPQEVQGGVGDHPIVSEVYPLPFMGREGDWRVLFDGRLKFCWNSLGNHQLFDLEADAREEQSLVAEQMETTSTMKSLLDAYLASLPKPPGAGPPVALDEETRKALRNLGYVK